LKPRGRGSKRLVNGGVSLDERMKRIGKALLSSAFAVCFFAALQFIKPSFWTDLSATWRYGLLIAGGIVVFGWSLCVTLKADKKEKD